MTRKKTPAQEKDNKKIKKEKEKETGKKRERVCVCDRTLRPSCTMFLFHSVHSVFISNYLFIFLSGPTPSNFSPNGNALVL
jgi:hypothetical protein